MALSYFRNIRFFKPTYTQNTLISTQLRTVTSKSTQKSSKTITTQAIDADDDASRPIEFLKSDAAKWKAHVSRSGVKEAGPWYQPYVITGSLSIFMLYFFFLREESDIDQEFNKNLYDRISGLEEKNLEIVLKYNEQNNMPTSDIENRLKEIRSGNE